MFAASDGDDAFVPPPECPVFEPTWDEFRDTMSYIQSIRTIAEKSGICKIRPPPEWQPPFVIDMDSFRFTPRIQKLNELEAQSRVKIIFLNGLAKFWKLQGIQLKIPMVDRKYLDLCKLQKLVREEGGFIMVCNERKWARVANRMNYSPGKGISSTLRSHYERILYPYDLFQAGVTTDTLQSTESAKSKFELNVEVTDLKIEPKEVKQVSVESKAKPECVYETRTKSRMMKDTTIGKTVPSVSSGTLNASQLERKNAQVNNKSSPGKNEEKKLITNVDQYFCEACNRGDSENLLLLCDGCDDAYHTFCLLPPLNEVPVGDWRCPKCVAKECHKPVEAYGFEQAEREYTLESFGEMADKFKTKYFKRPSHLVPTKTVEKEFWRLVSCLDEDVVVEYGADIHAAECGSGFPSLKNQTVIDDKNRIYVESGWNLNNLPVLPSSVLQFISADISGMKVPWCYVGMCFSSFSWHTEDHWSYSVNYMHWGEPKTWYGVPGAKAELLEECMKKIAPELFEQSPDLLHQLTTILNPNVLMAYGVPISRTDQHAGEFVITFPRSYHAGFNQGFNFAEAVNFCPVDWIPFGRASVDHYKELHRQCVFSNDELMCKMASVAETLDVALARFLYDDLELIFEEELRFRTSLHERGLTNLKKESFEMLPDDERQCTYCKTTCFLSSVTCACVPNVMVCLDHVDSLCRCSHKKRCLHYQMTDGELKTLLVRVKNRSEVLHHWQKKVELLMSSSEKKHEKPDLAELKSFIHQAVHEKLPESDQLKLLVAIVQEAEKIQCAVNQLTGSKVRTRQRERGKSKYAQRIKVDDIRNICHSIEGLQCSIRETDALQVLLKNIETFEEDSKRLLDSEELPKSAVVEEILSRATDFVDVDLMQLTKLQELLAQVKWLESLNAALEDQASLSVVDISDLIDSGSNLAPHPSCESAMAELQKLLTICHDLEQSASEWLSSWKNTGSKVERVVVQELLNKASKFEIYIPDLDQWADYLEKTDNWTEKALRIINETHLPHLDDIEALVSKGMQIPIGMELLDQLEQKLIDARSWLLNIAETLRNGNRQSLILQRILKQFLHLRSPLFAEDYKNVQSCSMIEEYLAVKSTCRKEMEETRSHNIKKLEQMIGTHAMCHVCKNEIVKLQRKCPVCLNVCHAKCLSQKCMTDRGQKLLIACSSCHRSGHPKLEVIESLVASYQALGVCLPIGEALSSLLSQSSNWRWAVADAFQTEELSASRKLLHEFEDRRSKNWESSADNQCGVASGNSINRDELERVVSETQVPAEHTYSAYASTNGIEEKISKLIEKKMAKKKLHPTIKLSKKSLAMLEELMLEGWIIDVEMEEMAEISHLIFYSQNGQRRKRTSSSVSRSGSEELPIKKYKMEKHKPSVASSVAFQQSIRNEKAKLNSSNRNNVGTKIAAGKTVNRKRQKSRETVKQKKAKQIISTNDASSDSDNDKDECCSAEKCQRPKAKKVNWVQCDHCLLWFHLLCIGQRMNQIAREKDYLCTACTTRSFSSTDSNISASHCLSSNAADSETFFGSGPLNSENCSFLSSISSLPCADSTVLTHVGINFSGEVIRD